MTQKDKMLRLVLSSPELMNHYDYEMSDIDDLDEFSFLEYIANAIADAETETHKQEIGSAGGKILYKETEIITAERCSAKNLLDDFAKALINFDNIIVTDIYAAREENIYEISSQDLVNKINELGKKAIFISDFNNISN